MRFESVRKRCSRWGIANVARQRVPGPRPNTRLSFCFNDFLIDFNLFCICIFFFKFKPHLISAVSLLLLVKAYSISAHILLGPVGFEHIFCMIVKIACDIVSTNY